MWIRFSDMYSGGSPKEDWTEIYIEASSQLEAINIFRAKFGHDPCDMACDCCGENYWISEYEVLEDALTDDNLDEADDSVLVIRKS